MKKKEEKKSNKRFSIMTCLRKGDKNPNGRGWKGQRRPHHKKVIKKIKGGSRRKVKGKKANHTKMIQLDEPGKIPRKDKRKSAAK